MNGRRRSTVHDLAALRLHRDGTRVLNSDTNRSSRRAKYAVHDSRGNWVAQDAGGLANVKQRRAASRPDDEAGAPEPEEDVDVLDETQHSPSSSKGKSRAREDEDPEGEHGINPRARKRRRFDEDLSYLTSASTPALASPVDIEKPDVRGEEQEPGALPVPSSVRFAPRSKNVADSSVLGSTEMSALLREHVLHRHGTALRRDSRVS